MPDLVTLRCFLFTEPLLLMFFLQGKKGLSPSMESFRSGISEDPFEQ